MPNTLLDYIIVGQGLAGSAVALQLLKREKKILVIDQPHNNTSSRIAAGLFNPLTGTGRNVKKTSMADQVFPYLHSFYQATEHLTGQKFFHSMPLYRPFYSIEEQNEWMGKSTDPAFSTYVNKIYTKKTIPYVNDAFGGLLLNQCGYLESGNYVRAIRALLENKGLFLEETFNHDEIKTDETGVIYKSYRAKKVIFCEGEKVLNSKWFKWLPVIPLKGETLTIHVSEPINQIINRGVYIVPSGKGEMRVGSTYNWDDIEANTTSKGREELIEKLDELVNFPYQIINQEWGMRPTTRDRRPILGAHPENPLIIVFNGLGTKGVSLAPYLSEILINWLTDGADLNKELDVNRYKLLYSKFTK
jgi:glycine oxidase